MKQEEVTYAGKYEQPLNYSLVTHEEANIKAGQASMISGDFSGEVYSQTYSEYINEGDSPTLTEIKNRTNEEVREGVVESLIDNSQDIESATKAVQNYLQSEQGVPTGVLAKEAMSLKEYTDQMFNEQVTYEQAKHELRKEVEEFKSGTTHTEDVGNFTALVVVPLLEDLKTESAADVKSWLQGNRIEELRANAMALPPKERIQYFNDLFDGLKDSPLKNTLVEAFTIEAVLEGQTNFDKWFGNFMTLLDSTAVGFAVSSGLKSIARTIGTSKAMTRAPLPESPIETIQGINPELAENLAEASISNKQSAEYISGTDSTGVFNETHMPSSSLDAVNKGMSSGLAKAERERKALQEDIYSQSSETGIRLTPEERAAKLAKAEQEAGDTAVLFGDMKVSVQQAGDSEYMTIKVPIANQVNGSSRPFKSPVDAFLTARKAGEPYGADIDNISLLKRNPITKEFDEVPKEDISKVLASDEKGQYIAQINTLQRYDTKGEASYADAVKFGSLQKILTVGGNNFSNWILDPANMFKSKVSSPLSVAADRKTAVNAKLVDMIDKDFADLGQTQKKAAWSVVESSNKKRKYYSEAELKKGVDGHAPLSDKEVNAVYSVYRFWDTLYHLDNRTLNRKLISQDYYRLSDDLTGDIYLGKPVKEAKGKVYNPQTKETMTAKEANARLSKDMGYEVYELRHAEDGADYVLKNSAMTGRRVKESDLTLKKIDGYVKRNYTTDYFVEAVHKVTGKTTVVASGSRFGDALGYVSKLRADEAYAEYTINTPRRAKELSDVDTLDKAFERGRSVERRRGAQLSGITDLDSNYGLANIENPIESMINAAASTSNASVMFDTIATMKGNFNETFKTQGKFPRSVEEVKDIRVNGVDKTAEAKALYKYIESMESGANTNLASTIYRDALFNMSEAIEEGGLLGKMSGTTGEAIRALAKIDPIRAARTLPHILFIAAAPLRQLVIQHSQLIQVMPLTAKYRNPYNLIKDVHIMRTLFHVKDDVSKFDKVVRSQAKWLNMSEQELRGLFKAFKESGLAESVHSNTMIERTFAMAGKDVYNNLGQSLAAKTGKVFTTIPHYGQKYGFDVGEFNNLVGSFMVAYQRQKEAKVLDLTSKTGMSSLASDARNLSWNMNHAGKFGYQTGLMSIPMQFIQVPHKAILNMITGSGTLTRAERMKVAGTNLVLFGTAGFGIDAALDPIADDVSPEVYGLAQDGMLNLVLNSFGDFITGGDGSNVDYGASFNPVTSPFEIMEAPVKALLEGKVEMGGAFFGAAKKVTDVATRTKHIYSMTELDESIAPEEQLGLILRNLATVYSGSSHFETYLLQKRTERLLSLTGTDAGRATAQEIAAKLVGMRTVKEQEMFDISTSVRDIQKSYEQDMRRSAREYNKANLALETYLSSGEQPPEELFIKLTQPKRTAQLYSEADYAYAGKEILSEMKRFGANVDEGLATQIHYVVKNVPEADISNGTLVRRFRELASEKDLTPNEKALYDEYISIFEGDK